MVGPTKLEHTIRRTLGAALAVLLLPALLELPAFLANEYWAVPLTPDARVDYAELAVRNARADGRQPDTRPVGEVIESTRRSGANAFPLLSVAYYLDAQRGSKMELDNEPVLPLSLEPNGIGFYCNESGEYAQFNTDRYGFRNPDRVWDNRSHSVLLVGDSIAMGSCLPENQAFAGRLRPRYPDMLNLAIGANGPLMELATLREYLPALTARKVLWVYFQNDLEDLVRDAANPILQRYRTDPTFSQQLLKNWQLIAPKISVITQTYLDGVLKVEAVARETPSAGWSAKRSYLARRIRYWYGLLTTEPPALAPEKDLVSVIRQAHQFARTRNAAFAVVYIPDCTGSDKATEVATDNVLRSLISEGIEIIDTRPELRRVADAGGKTFAICPGGHLTSKGSQAIAESIAPRL